MCGGGHITRGWWWPQETLSQIRERNSLNRSLIDDNKTFPSEEIVNRKSDSKVKEQPLVLRMRTSAHTSGVVQPEDLQL